MNERDNELLLSISKAFTVRLKKYLPDFKLIIKAEAKMSIIYSVKEIMSCLVLSRGRREEKHRFLDHTIIVFTSSCNCEI